MVFLGERNVNKKGKEFYSLPECIDRMVASYREDGIRMDDRDLQVLSAAKENASLLLIDLSFFEVTMLKILLEGALEMSCLNKRLKDSIRFNLNGIDTPSYLN